ncbi:MULTISPECIES: integrase domain-containing protein [unclassified Halomonas]|uniref:integrase domain-containing protein n=1 Tax=unclassified Halomonas TaxID=2609666 RepID=UPI00288600FD|nr:MULTISPECIES: integrase domain-containing protein [unclassified Halomonas]MDT0513400.1 integrase domain-containing protein [Halomonas sp. LES1]MDT0591833.1 integrase domain-containing protein [Halomonas sp. PAR8]
MSVPRGYLGWSEKRRNFGYGRRLGYAALSALHDHYGQNDHHQTKHTHHVRFQNFARWIREHYQIRDAREIEKSHILEYAEHLLESVQDVKYSVAYAQNLLSTVNIVLRCLRHDRRLVVSPSQLVGRRTHVRQTVPQGEKEIVKDASDALQKAHNPRAAAILLLARAFGMRVREASLANLERLKREALKNGECRILEGTKGGRRCNDRTIPMEEEQWNALNYALQTSPKNSNNLLEANESFIEFRRKFVNPGRLILQAYGLISYQEMRAAFAIETYEEEAGHLAPIKCTPTNREAHLRAQKLTARRLGHYRANVSRAYIG